MRLLAGLVLAVAALAVVGCASLSAPRVTQPVSPESADLECIEVFETGPIR